MPVSNETVNDAADAVSTAIGKHEGTTSGIIVAIVFATIALVISGFIISSQFEKPEQLVTSKYLASEMTLMSTNAVATVYQDRYNCYSKLQALQDEKDAKEGKKKAETTTYVTIGGLCSPGCSTSVTNEGTICYNCH